MGIAASGRGRVDERVWLVLGFGLFMVSYGGGPFGFVSGTSHQGVAWQSLLFIQTAFFASAVLGCMGVRLLIRRGGRPNYTLGALGLAAVALFGLAMQPLLDGMTNEGAVVARMLLSAVVGALYAVPFLFWVARFLDLGKTSSHLSVVGALILCYLLLPVAVLPCSFIEMPYGYSVVQAACAVASAALQLLFIRRGQGAGTAAGCATGEPLSSSRPQAPLCERLEEGDDRYRLTRHSLLLLTCLGFSWGVSNGSSMYGLMNISAGGTSSGLVNAFALMFAAALAVWAFRRRPDMKFGFAIRLSIVACGAVLAALPLLYVEFPQLLYPACNLAMIAGEILLVLFTIDICIEEGRSVGPVFALNYVVFMGASCLSTVLFYAAHELIGGLTAWLVVSLAAVWLVLAAVPSIPSRSSDAAALMSRTLPENEGYEANIAMRRDRMVRRYSLTDGEALVLEGLMQGKKREEIARDLLLSPWTIKARTSSIYKKCGVGSFKELLQLVSKD